MIRKMVCIGLIGCSHTHTSTGGFIVMALLVMAFIWGLRVVLYVIAGCLQSRWRGSSDDGGGGDQIEMRTFGNILAMHHQQQQQWRRSSGMRSPPALAMIGDWQSKLVISAGNDHVSCIAHPCPLLGNRDYSSVDVYICAAQVSG